MSSLTLASKSLPKIVLHCQLQLRVHGRSGRAARPRAVRTHPRRPIQAAHHELHGGPLRSLARVSECQARPRAQGTPDHVCLRHDQDQSMGRCRIQRRDAGPSWATSVRLPRSTSPSRSRTPSSRLPTTERGRWNGPWAAHLRGAPVIRRKSTINAFSYTTTSGSAGNGGSRPSSRPLRDLVILLETQMLIRGMKAIWTSTAGRCLLWIATRIARARGSSVSHSRNRG